jgi:hypothetical protein
MTYLRKKVNNVAKDEKGLRALRKGNDAFDNSIMMYACSECLCENLCNPGCVCGTSSGKDRNTDFYTPGGKNMQNDIRSMHGADKYYHNV